MEFYTALETDDLYIKGLKKVNFAQLEILWAVDLEVRNYGIKSLSAYVLSVGVFVEDENQKNHAEDIDFEVTIDLDFYDGGLWITEADIDLEEKTIHIS